MGVSGIFSFKPTQKKEDRLFCPRCSVNVKNKRYRFLDTFLLRSLAEREGLATTHLEDAPLNAFPFCSPQGKSPALCQREGTEGRECKYVSPAKLKPTFAEIGGGIDLAMLVATSHRKLFP